ncbi:MAG: hypothetical protein WAK17_08975 [Candidatus Nitrosopolaris sp.]|jgi:methionine-rich copper-binding protein CopC
MNGDRSTAHQPADGEVIQSTPKKVQLKLLEKISHHGTDTTSFRFARS